MGTAEEKFQGAKAKCQVNAKIQITNVKHSRPSAMAAWHFPRFES
jgi:hypothetical protein